MGFFAALLPLAVLVALQTRWLADLEKASRAARSELLQVFARDLAEHLRQDLLERHRNALEVPASILDGYRDFTAGEAHFGRQPLEGVKRYYLGEYVVSEDLRTMRVYFYDPEDGVLFDQYGDDRPRMETLEPETFRAAYMACSLWSILSYNELEVEKPPIQADHRVTESRTLFQPLVDEDSHLIGLVGLMIDEAVYREELLPGAIREGLTRLFNDVARPEEFFVRVVDGAGEEVLRLGGPPPDDASGVLEGIQPMPLVFGDWTLHLSGPIPEAKRFARADSRLNFALLVALVALLLAGLVLALGAASRAMRLSQMKSDFVSNVSHELRTPLASIRVFGELLRLGKVDRWEKVQEYGEYIETESRRLTQLVNNILDFSRIESGGREYHLETADLTEVVGETLEVFRVRLRQRGFRVTFERPEEPLPVRVDPTAIAQALSNLLDNAVKYSEDSREIAVRVERRGDSAAVEVQDWGLGIPRAEQRKIFDRFHRVGTGLVHDVKGSGLGLAITHHILDAHGGSVEVTSRTGQGSTFVLCLPLEEAPDRPTVSTETYDP